MERVSSVRAATTTNPPACWPVCRLLPPRMLFREVRAEIRPRGPPAEAEAAASRPKPAPAAGLSDTATHPETQKVRKQKAPSRQSRRNCQREINELRGSTRDRVFILVDSRANAARRAKDSSALRATSSHLPGRGRRGVKEKIKQGNKIAENK